MSEALEKYRALEAKLIRVRWLNRGLESPEEDDVLNQMEVVWYELSASERELIDVEEPKSLISAEVPGSRTVYDEDVWEYPQAPPRRREVA